MSSGIIKNHNLVVEPLFKVIENETFNYTSTCQTKPIYFITTTFK